jgi:dihydrofolate reductase
MSRRHEKSGLTSIVAVGLDGAIGVENRLPWRLKSDLRFFKETTKQNVIIMGRKTYDSLGSCLPYRENIVLSHTPSLFPPHEGCHHVHSLSEALTLRTRWPGKSAFVIGGAQTYKQFAPFVDRYLITIVSARFPNADAFFDQGIFGDEKLWEKCPVKVDRVDDAAGDEFEFQVFELRLRDPTIASERREALIGEQRSRNHLYRSKQNGQAVRHAKPVQTLNLFA